MNDTKITLSQNEIKNRFPVGHMGGKEISTPTIPTIMAGAGAFRSTAADMLKYAIHTVWDTTIRWTMKCAQYATSKTTMTFV